MLSRPARCVLVLIAAATMWRCGSSPASPSGGVKLQGVVLQDATAGAASASVSAQSAKPGKITVTVQEVPALSVTVSSNGTFAIEGLPAGGFTLLFSVNGAPVGAIAITAVGEGTTIKIVVKVTEQEVELVDMETDGDDATGGLPPITGGPTNTACMINGGKMGAKIELEGNVDSVSTTLFFKLRVNGNRASGLVDVAAAGASYKCNGKPSTADCKASLRSGAKVHVRGNLTNCSATAASVTAIEVKIQK